MWLLRKERRDGCPGSVTDREGFDHGAGVLYEVEKGPKRLFKEPKSITSTKENLISLLQEKSGLKKYEAKNFIKTMIGIIKTELIQNGNVTICLFGCFEVRARKKRICQNLISAKGCIIVPSHRTIKF